MFNSDLRGFLFQSSDTSVSSSPISLVRSSLKPEPEPALPEPAKVGLLLCTAILVLLYMTFLAVALKVTNALNLHLLYSIIVKAVAWTFFSY